MGGTDTQAPRAPCSDRSFFAGFTFNADQTLEALAGFYGIRIPTVHSQITLAQYLGQICHGRLRRGFRIDLGNAELIALEVQGDVIMKVGLRFASSPRRGPVSYPDTYSSIIRRTAGPLYSARSGTPQAVAPLS